MQQDEHCEGTDGSHDISRGREACQQLLNIGASGVEEDVEHLLLCQECDGSE